MILHGYWYGVRVCTQHPISKFVSNDSSSPPHCAFVSALTSLFVPEGLQEPLERPKWKETIVEEMGTLSKNDTWQLVSLPTGKKTVGCKWVFTVKQEADCRIEPYKSRLAAKASIQNHRIDHMKTLCSSTKMNTIQVIL